MEPITKDTPTDKIVDWIVDDPPASQEEKSYRRCEDCNELFQASGTKKYCPKCRSARISAAATARAKKQRAQSSKVKIPKPPKHPKAPDQTIKADAGKPQLRLVPPDIIRAIAYVREYGVRKYGSADGWSQVEPERYIDAAYRHMLAFAENPFGRDEESRLPHLWMLACNVAFLCALYKQALQRCDVTEETGSTENNHAAD